MSSFLTLIRRDIADHRGTVFWTPTIVAAVMVLLVITAAVIGRLELGDFTEWTTNNGAPSTSISMFGVDALRALRGPEGQLLFDNGTGAKPFHAFLDANQRHQIEQAYAATTAIMALPVMLLAMITLPFALSATLYEERKDRSILFWKSLPVSDLEAVGSRMFSLPLGTMGWAVVAGIAAHLVLFLVGLPIVLSNGFLPGLSAGLIGALFQAWAVLGLMALLYVLWAAPVHAWFLLVSSAAPKAPFIIAIAPFVLIPLFGTVLALDSSWVKEPISRLIGYPVLEPLGADVAAWDAEQSVRLSGLFAPLLNSFAKWQLWAGVAVAAALVFASSEIRRRRTL
jgi:ABC-2 type transport system permease protein